MFAFTFCLESKNKHLLYKTQWDSVTWYYAYCLLHSSYYFSIIFSPSSGSGHQNFFRTVKDSVYKLQNIAFVGVTWVHHFIIKNRIDTKSNLINFVAYSWAKLKILSCH
jgi:hypothetical protein